jgi:hypothetical protein
MKGVLLSETFFYQNTRRHIMQDSTA